MKNKVLSLIMILTLTFVGFVAWRVDHFVYSDKRGWLESQARSEGQFVESVVLGKIKQVESVVKSGAFRQSDGQINWSVVQPFSVVAQFQITAGAAQVQNLQLQRSDVFPGSALSLLSQEVALAMQDKRQSSVRAISFQVNNRSMSGLIINANAGSFVLLSEGSFLGKHREVAASQISSVEIVSTNGRILSHSEPGYIGTTIAGSEIFQEALRARSEKGLATLKLADGEDGVGYYNRVPQTNIFILSAFPLSAVMADRWATLGQLGLMGLGFALFAGLALFVMWRSIEGSFALVEARIAALLRGDKSFQQKAIPFKEVAHIDGLLASLQLAEARKMSPSTSETSVLGGSVQSADRAATYAKVAGSLAHELRSPIISVLGYSQMVLSQNPSKEITEATESIQREIRHAKGVLDKLLVFSGEKASEKSEMKVESPLLRALKNLEPLFQQKGVRVIKDIGEAQPFAISSEPLALAFENIMRNAVEAMERMPKKELKVALKQTGSEVMISIADSGEGIASEQMSKLFDPFYTTRSFLNHVGLGLSFAQGVVREHQGKIEVVSEKGQGSQFKIIFDVSNAKSVAPVQNDATVLVPRELPELGIEIKVTAEEKSQMQAEKKSPLLDVNLEDLLSLPEVEESQSSFSSTNSQVKVSEDSLLDLGLDQAEPKAMSAVESSAIEDEKTPVDFINPPDFVVSAKENPLDEFAVEIRRPRVRLD